ncbi:MAG: transposase [Desulfarculus sp.]|nr:transposase [Desulfarculus sp.]
MTFSGVRHGQENKGSSLIAFQQRFATEQACIVHLAALRWPDGYNCQKCGGDKAYQLKVEPRVFMCSRCNFQESVTAGTLLHRTKLPLVK